MAQEGLGNVEEKEDEIHYGREERVNKDGRVIGEDKSWKLKNCFSCKSEYKATVSYMPYEKIGEKFVIYARTAIDNDWCDKGYNWGTIRKFAGKTFEEVKEKFLRANEDLKMESSGTEQLCYVEPEAWFLDEKTIREIQEE